MKRSFMVVMSLVVLVVLNTMGSSSLRASAAAQEASCSNTTSTPTSVPIVTPTVPGARTVISDGCITVWSDAPNFSTKTEPFRTSAIVVQSSLPGNWNITIPKLSIPWSSNSQLTLQNGKVASGVFQSATNTMMLTIPLQGLPVVKTATFNVSTSGSIKTTDGQTISGSAVDPKGDTTLVGSRPFTMLFLSYQAQVRIQCKLSPWPLLSNR
jgi:hypothetical protein